ncbi:Uncharacterized protein HZ326_7242 [Fusarium oxysporum f. sp. albedinis]|nr:Uncharacterized protein HZ326_7242 [Fusarium oxysporum f. sp. albedinis]
MQRCTVYCGVDVPGTELGLSYRKRSGIALSGAGFFIIRAMTNQKSLRPEMWSWATGRRAASLLVPASPRRPSTLDPNLLMVSFSTSTRLFLTDRDSAL